MIAMFASFAANAQTTFACDGKEVDLSSFRFVEQIEDFFVNNIYMKETSTEVQVAHVRIKDGAPYSYEIYYLPKNYFTGKGKEKYLNVTMVGDEVYSVDLMIEPEKKVIKCSMHTCGDDYWLENEPWTKMEITFTTKEAALQILNALIKA